MTQIAVNGAPELEQRLRDAGYDTQGQDATLVVLGDDTPAPADDRWLRVLSPDLVDDAVAAALDVDGAVDFDALDRIRTMMGGPGERFNDFLDLYIREAAKYLRAMDDAARQQDADAISLAAHSLKPSSGMVGAKHLQTACRDLELAAKEGWGDHLLPLITIVRSRYLAASAALAAALEAA